MATTAQNVKTAETLIRAFAVALGGDTDRAIALAISYVVFGGIETREHGYHVQAWPVRKLSPIDPAVARRAAGQLADNLRIVGEMLDAFGLARFETADADEIERILRRRLG